MKLVNLTPHPITILGNGLTINIQPSGTVARVMQKSRNLVNMDLPIADNIEMSIVVQDAQGTYIVDLPEPEEGTYYIVSTLVAQLAQRPDLLAPLTDETAEKDELGRIVGVRGFRRFLP